MEKSIHCFVQHAITSINTLQLLMVIELSYGYCCFMIFNLHFSLNKSDIGFYHEIYMASPADLCQPDLINIGRGPLRAVKLLGKIQEDACFVGFKHYFHMRLLLTQMVLIVVHYEYH